METARESDEWLMAQVALGRRELLEMLIHRYATPLLTFVYRMTGDHQSSEELFQEVFLAVWTQADGYKYPRPFKSWLFGIAANKCRAEFRRRHRFPVLLETKDVEALQSKHCSPPQLAIEAETELIISQAVSRLPMGQRTVLVLRIWNGLAYREIASVVGCSEDTTRSQMFHALAAVRRYLEPRLR